MSNELTQWRKECRQKWFFAVGKKVTKSKRATRVFTSMLVFVVWIWERFPCKNSQNAQNKWKNFNCETVSRNEAWLMEPLHLTVRVIFSRTSYRTTAFKYFFFKRKYLISRQIYVALVAYLHSLETDAKNRSCIHLHCLLNWRWR